MTDFTHCSMLTGTSALAATALTSSIGQIWKLMGDPVALSVLVARAARMLAYSEGRINN